MGTFEETYNGSVQLSSGMTKPLGSRQLLGMGRKGAASARKGGGLEKMVRRGRPLAEVIAAANATLEGRAEQQLSSGLLELCK